MEPGQGKKEEAEEPEAGRGRGGDQREHDRGQKMAIKLCHVVQRLRLI